MTPILSTAAELRERLAASQAHGPMLNLTELIIDIRDLMLQVAVMIAEIHEQQSNPKTYEGQSRFDWEAYRMTTEQLKQQGDNEERIRRAEKGIQFPPFGACSHCGGLGYLRFSGSGPSIVFEYCTCPMADDLRRAVEANKRTQPDITPLK